MTRAASSDSDSSGPVAARNKNEASSTVRHRGMGTLLMGTILRFASVPLRKMGTDLLGSWWPCQCVLPTLKTLLTSWLILTNLIGILRELSFLDN